MQAEKNRAGNSTALPSIQILKNEMKIAFHFEIIKKNVLCSVTETQLLVHPFDQLSDLQQPLEVRIPTHTRHLLKLTLAEL